MTGAIASQQLRTLEARTVLLVEDNFIVAHDLCARLMGWRMRVSGPFASLSAAEQAFTRSPCDVALLDVNVRGESSLQLAEKLLDAGVVSLFITGYGEIPNLPARLAHLPRLAKPFGPETLRHALASVLNRCGPAGP